MRAHRVRSRIQGTQEKPRLSVFRSLQYHYAQLIDDENRKTIAQASDMKMKKGSKMERAKEVGKMLAKEALEKGIKTCIFDRGGYAYHGRVKAIAEGAREGGLKF